jgi:cytochrome c oxidase subunit 3
VKSLDVSGLPSYRYGHHSLMWWGMMGLIAIEGTVFVLAVMAYFYLWSQAPAWPLNAAPPDLRWATLNLAILLASVWPNHWTKRAGEDGDERKMRTGLVVLMFTGPVEGRRHVDVAENAMYWYFVVYSWIPIYAVLYWMPRLP